MKYFVFSSFEWQWNIENDVGEKEENISTKGTCFCIRNSCAINIMHISRVSLVGLIFLVIVPNETHGGLPEQLLEIYIWRYCEAVCWSHSMVK